jgi:hypothetical protein
MKKLALFALLASGCGGGYTPTLTPTSPLPVAQNATVSGQYILLLTSTLGHGTTNIYSNFTQTGTAFTGAANTLVCPSNDLLQCVGGDAAVTPIMPSGTVSGENVSMTISFPSAARPDTFKLIGSLTATGISGTYTDTLGDAGIWASGVASSIIPTYGGTFNSTTNPLPIAPTIFISLVQDDALHITGTGTVMNWPCASSLTFSGDAIGIAFELTDADSKLHILGLPQSNNFAFSYKFEPTAPHCAGDFGQGMTDPPPPWDYLQPRR